MSRPDPDALIDALLAPLAPPCHPVQRDRNRAAVLEFLYAADGRDDPAHPHAFTYTGLAQQYHQIFGRWLLEQLTEAWHLDAEALPLPEPGPHPSGRADAGAPVAP